MVLEALTAPVFDHSADTFTPMITNCYLNKYNLNLYFLRRRIWFLKNTNYYIYVEAD